MMEEPTSRIKGLTSLKSRAALRDGLNTMQVASAALTQTRTEESATIPERRTRGLGAMQEASSAVEAAKMAVAGSGVISTLTNATRGETKDSDNPFKDSNGHPICVGNTVTLTSPSGNKNDVEVMELLPANGHPSGWGIKVQASGGGKMVIRQDEIRPKEGREDGRLMFKSDGPPERGRGR